MHCSKWSRGLAQHVASACEATAQTPAITDIAMEQVLPLVLHVVFEARDTTMCTNPDV